MRERFNKGIARFIICAVIFGASTAARAGVPADELRAVNDYPVNVRNCFETVRFDATPKRVLVNDANMLQTFIDLGLQHRIMAVSAIAGRERFIAAPPGSLTALKHFSQRYPTLEAVIAQEPDFMFAGWSYGFDTGRAITPKGLAEFGIATYTLRESCIRIGRREPMSMELMYDDLLALGAIFGVRQRAQMMVEGYRQRVQEVALKVGRATHRPRVMYCGDCSSASAPLSSGGEGMPALLANLAGGKNIFDDIASSYVRVSWEEVVNRNPQWILVSDDRVSAEQHIRHMLQDPQLKNVEAVRERRFIKVTYPQRSPSTRNVETLERIARILHPELFKQ